MHALTLNGLEVKISRGNVKIFDEFIDASDEEVKKIINYLQAEGFLDNYKNIKVTIIQGKSRKYKHEKKCTKKV